MKKWIMGFVPLLIITVMMGLFTFIAQRKALEQKLEHLKTQNEALQLRLNQLENRLYRLLIESKVSRLRQLPFLKEPLYQEIGREELRTKLLEEVNKEFPGQGLENIRKVLVKFGFLEPDYDLAKNIVSLYGEQIGAFYDMDEKALFSIKGLPLGQGLQNALLAHELTHTLQDQHFKIKNLVDEKSKNDDLELAHEALIEGDATFITQLYYINSINLSFFWDLLSYLFIDQKQFGQAPMVLQENMLFPYIKGMDFIMHLFNQKGWEGVNLCFQNPPASTEQILHPTKYLLGNDPPQKIVIPALKEVLPTYGLLEENVLGEFNIQLLFKKILGRQANSKISEGWGGDAYQLWEEQDKKELALIWESSWDAPADAYEFFDAYRQLVVQKYTGAILQVSGDDLGLWKAQDQWVFLARSQGRILMIEAGDKETIDKIRNSFEEFKDSAYNI